MRGADWFLAAHIILESVRKTMRERNSGAPDWIRTGGPQIRNCITDIHTNPYSSVKVGLGKGYPAQSGCPSGHDGPAEPRAVADR